MTGNIYYDYLRIALKRAIKTKEDILITVNKETDIDKYYLGEYGALKQVIRDLGIIGFVDIVYDKKYVKTFNGSFIFFTVSTGVFKPTLPKPYYQTMFFPNLYYMSAYNINCLLNKLRQIKEEQKVHLYYNSSGAPYTFERVNKEFVELYEYKENIE